MKLAALYSLASGLKADKPFVYKAFYPVPHEKYIVLHASSGNACKNYPFYQDVLDLVKDKLEENGIKIIQLGEGNDIPLMGCIPLQGRTTIHQTAYIIDKSLGLLGNDSMLAHIAASFNVPVVALYGPTSVSAHSPYWINKDKTILIESERNGNNPSYSFGENPSTMRLIKPETVATALLKVLGLNDKISQETFYIGPRYSEPILEVVPDTVVSVDFAQAAVINLRCDYDFNPQNIYNQVHTRPCLLITDKPLDVNILIQLKRNVAGVLYRIEKDTHKPDFVAQLRAAGIKYHLYTHLTESELTDLKLDYMDLGIIQIEPLKTREAVDKKELITSNTKFKCRKVILSQGKFFASRVHQMLGQPMNHFHEAGGNIIDTPKFWEEIDFFTLYNS